MAKKNITVDPKLVLDKKKFEAFIETNHPDHHEELQSFKKQLRNLIIIAIGGLFWILVIFLIVHFNK
ncbi:MAG: hypothetical protein HKN51_05520 [Saprospiraceae bacterium]|nr:hypothetical protein [Saprospiraceae bacterium]